MGDELIGRSTVNTDRARPKDVKSGPREWDPERALAVAVLSDALDCVLWNSDANSAGRRREYIEARLWIDNRQDDGPYSFENLCGSLGLDPEAVRRALDGQISGHTGKRIACKRLRRIGPLRPFEERRRRSHRSRKSVLRSRRANAAHEHIERGARPS